MVVKTDKPNFDSFPQKSAKYISKSDIFNKISIYIASNLCNCTQLRNWSYEALKKIHDSKICNRMQYFFAFVMEMQDVFLR